MKYDEAETQLKVAVHQDFHHLKQLAIWEPGFQYAISKILKLFSHLLTESPHFSNEDFIFLHVMRT